MPDKYRLLKDLPDGAVKGNIYHLQGDRYVHTRTISQKSPVLELNSYFKWQVESNPEWFSKVEEELYTEEDMRACWRRAFQLGCKDYMRHEESKFGFSDYIKELQSKDR